VLSGQVAATQNDPCVRVLLEAIEGYLLIINSRRQILAANRELLEALRRESPDCLLGLRPGEALGCVHFTEGTDGCGTAKHCQSCGAVFAILSSQANNARVTNECRLSTLSGGKFGARDFRVTASPLEIQGEKLTALVLVDISSEKRREVLEQTFLHDVANCLGGIEFWGRAVRQLGPELAAKEILALAETIKLEVFSQRALLEAERGGLCVKAGAHRVRDILAAVGGLFQTRGGSQGSSLKVLPAEDAIEISTDKGLLLRILDNMVKNAFEAVAAGETVQIGFEARPDGPTFVVENAGMIAEEVQTHIFERSYSTKAAKGRGLGTYSMKLFGERYLGGRVGFACEGGKTRFWIVLPPLAMLGRQHREADSATAPVPAVATGNGRAKKVMLVEDDEAISRLETTFLKRLGFEVVACYNGVEAEAAFQTGPAGFSAVITDARMPRMDGMELCRRLHSVRADVPVILCTGGGNDEIKAALGSGQFAAVLSKPISLAVLKEGLRRAIAG
jgi:CheY-like chemotaxis protein